MAIIATAFGWMVVKKGVWTRIGQGPLVQFLPFQSLELAATMDTLPTPISVTMDGYSAAPPFYERDTTMTNSKTIGWQPLGVPPIGHTGNSTLLTSYLNSPWVEFWLLLSMDCWAHISAF